MPPIPIPDKYTWEQTDMAQTARTSVTAVIQVLLKDGPNRPDEEKAERENIAKRFWRIRDDYLAKVTQLDGPWVREDVAGLIAAYVALAEVVEEIQFIPDDVKGQVKGTLALVQALVDDFRKYGDA